MGHVDLDVSNNESFELTADEPKALITLLRQTLDYAAFPFAPRLDPLKAILAKLDPPKPKEPRPPLQPGLSPSHGQRRRQR